MNLLRRLRDASIRDQLVAIMLSISALTLVATTVTVFVIDAFRTRNAVADELTSLAQLVGSRSSAAIVFGDERTAAENLSALMGIPHVGQACLFDEQRKVLSAATARGGVAGACEAFAPLGEPIVIHDGLAASAQVPIHSEGKLIGALQIRSTKAPMVGRLAAHGASLLAALLGASILAFLLTLRLHPVISRPIAAIRDVANSIAKGNLAHRAPESGQNEIGQLASSFNRMLDRIDRQQQELAQSENYARRLFFDSPVPQIVSEAALGRFIDCNRAAAALCGYDGREALVGQGLRDILSDSLYDGRAIAEIAVAIAHARTSGRPCEFEWEFRRPDWSSWVGAVYAVAYDLEGRELVHLALHDITHERAAEEAIRNLNVELESRVARRTEQLEKANAEVQAALDSLRRAQDELVQQEKLASLGALVAGVAHELNTPLGNSLTVSTTLEEELATLMAEIEKGALRRSSLTAFTERLRTGLTLLHRNLHLANDQILHFKQVAVDQTSAQRRAFDLHAMVEEVAQTLWPQFKKTPHRIVLEIGPGISMDSYPGPLGQIVTNLVLNSLIHAFTPEKPGVVTIRAIEAGKQVELLVSDNGRGIPPESVSRIFDPFFTTRMGQGGSGLGLHIVYNIATATLGGTITVESAVGSGTTFRLQFPRVAPARKGPAHE